MGGREEEEEGREGEEEEERGEGAGGGARLAGERKMVPSWTGIFLF